MNKSRLMEEIEKIEGAIRRLTDKTAWDRQTADNLGQFLSTAFDRFTNGSVAAKREVALAMGGSYTLTGGRLQVSPHPLLAPLLRIEPPKNGELQVQVGKNVPGVPALCSTLDQIRKVMDEQDVSFPKLIVPMANEEQGLSKGSLIN